MWYFYTMESYAAGRKKELLPFTTAGMELETIMLHKIKQPAKNNLKLFCQTVFQCGSIIFHAYQQCSRISAFLSELSMISHVNFSNSRTSLTVLHCGFIMHSLMTIDVEQFFMCIFTIQKHFVKCL